MIIDLGDGKELVITSFGASDEAIYVQSLKINGESWDKAWVSWEDIFKEEGTMEYVLDTEPNGWSRDGELPPSRAG